MEKNEDNCTLQYTNHTALPTEPSKCPLHDIAAYLYTHSRFSPVITSFSEITLNHLTPNDPYMSRTALLTSKHCILYIYSTNVGTEYLNMLYILRFWRVNV